MNRRPIRCLIIALLITCTCSLWGAAAPRQALAENLEIFQAKDSSKLEQFKARVFNGFIDLETEIDVSDIGITAGEVVYQSNGNNYSGAFALAAETRAHPLFSTLCVGYSGISFETSGLTISKVKVSYLSTWTDSLLSSFKTNYAEFLNGVPAGATEFQKAAYVHDWVCAHTSYSMQTVNLPDFALGSIANGKALCTGYSYAYQFLAQQIGLECNYVSGTTKVEAHAWNQVKIDGQWFLVDTTWDRALSGADNFGHTYFMLNDTEFASAGDGSHDSDTSVVGKSAENTAYYFANKFWQGVSGSLSSSLLAQDPQLTKVTVVCTEHGWDEGVVSVQPTCAAEGVKTYVCTVCGATKTEAVAKTNSHAWDDGKITKQPTVSSEGEKTYACTVCGATKTEAVAKLEAPELSVSYRAHVQSIGWQGWVSDGATAGTSGRSLRVEALQIRVKGDGVDEGVLVNAHVQSVGWQGWRSGEGGTSGQSRRIEAVRLKLPDSLSETHSVYYRAHVQGVGWMGWARDGGSAGSAGYSRRVEALQVVVRKKTDPAPSSDGSVTTEAFLGTSVSYRAHAQTYGWLAAVSNGDAAGTTGQSKRLEALEFSLSGTQYAGGIEASAHVQTYGWQGWDAPTPGSCGTSGEAKRLEAVRIRLTGEAAEHVDVYYRVHAQRFGWMGWAKNGDAAGTAGYAYRLEAVQVRLVPKGAPAPSGADAATKAAFVSK